MSVPSGAKAAPNGKIYVTNRGSNTVSAIPGFPTVTSISPNQGPTTGGTVVTITGTHLTGASVDIGGHPATGVSVNPAGTQITATTDAQGTARLDETLTLTLILLNGGCDAKFAGTGTLLASSAHAGVLEP
ncbi:IPT/TIG domain-containing protein [Streptomyces sioyaensis]|uniref:IPT/TIG domain-containing protein n=1 Tax=Streptomyces sioyaensis TaxID=67364 RepID=UPI001F406D9F|nr:IPT/TIG domain-containing protein [Streptomyces sioyaensis]